VGEKRAHGEDGEDDADSDPDSDAAPGGGVKHRRVQQQAAGGAHGEEDSQEADSSRDSGTDGVGKAVEEDDGDDGYIKF
jgi:hypothetical protein